jgi:tRNA dimethylallyltransferase
VPGATIEKEDIERIFHGLAIEAKKQIPLQLPRQKKRVIVIAGPTACGKSNFALPLAQGMGGEIISADSMQIYRGMDIGTSKPSKEELSLVPHHLIDIQDVTDSFNVVDFYYEARHCCQKVLSRDNVPIFVGGSGFYIHTLLYGPPSGPPSVPELRQAIEREMEKLGTDVLFERLKGLDPLYASTITKNDKQKIVRALEIMTLTGKMVSKLTWKGRRKPLNYDFRCWFLFRPREKLYEMINQRCMRMVEQGLIAEVEELLEKGLKTNSSASQAIGYRQTIQYLESARTKKDYEFFLNEFMKASRHYAKRQYTWFGNESLFRWVDMDMHEPEMIMDMIQKDYLSF